MVATGGQVIKVHCGCCPGGLLGGLSVWRGGSRGISKRGCGLSWSCFISFHFLCIEATVSNHVIKVHHCCCPGGLLDGLRVGRGGLGGICCFNYVCARGPMGRRLATSMVGDIWKKHFKGIISLLLS